MYEWTADELAVIDHTDELRVSSYRPDGTLRPWVTIWVVRVEDEVYIRSAYGTDNRWFRRAAASGTGRVQVGSIDKDVRFTTPDAGGGEDIHGAIDTAYHAKYDRYAPQIVGTVVGPRVVDVTFRLVPSS